MISSLSKTKTAAVILLCCLCGLGLAHLLLRLIKQHLLYLQPTHKGSRKGHKVGLNNKQSPIVFHSKFPSWCFHMGVQNIVQIVCLCTIIHSDTSSYLRCFTFYHSNLRLRAINRPLNFCESCEGWRIPTWQCGKLETASIFLSLFPSLALNMKWFWHRIKSCKGQSSQSGFMSSSTF